MFVPGFDSRPHPLDASLAGLDKKHAFDHSRSGSALPAHDTAQSQAEADILTRWCAAYGLALDVEGARARVITRLARLAARHAEER